MLTLSTQQARICLAVLALFHILVITASNYLVQIPFTVFGIHNTWGAFTFPFIFLATDLTVRLFGAALARRIIFVVMLPALLVSYAVSVLFFEGAFQGVAQLSEFNLFVGRIALASFAAYLVGQIMDVQVFNRLRQLRQWWIAPMASTVLGNLIDSLVFFSVAFWRSSDAFMAEHWLQIGAVDYGFKLLISLLLFLPLYGVLLKSLQQQLLRFATPAEPQPAQVASLA